MSGRAGVDEQAPMSRERLAHFREHIPWVLTLKASDMDGISAVNLAGDCAELLAALDSLAAELVSLKDALGEAEQTIVTHQRWVSEVLDRVAERPAEEVDWVQEVYRPLRELPIPAAAAREALGRPA